MNHAGSVTIRGIRQDFGDAVLTFYRVSVDSPAAGTDSGTGEVHSHFYYECHILTEGDTVFLADGREIPVKKRELLLLPPGTVHQAFRKTSDNSEIVFILTLDKTEGEAGLHAYFQTTLEEIALLPLELPAPLFEKFRLFHARFNYRDFRELCLQKTLAAEIITALFDRINGFRIPAVMRDRPDLDTAKQLRLEYLITGQHPVSAIAESMGYTVRHTNRLIRQIYGESLSSIRNRLRLDTARRLLTEHPELSVDEVAERAGYISSDSMRRAFRKAEQQPPSSYRIRHKGESEHD